MADLKISQLTDGGASQATDEYVVARSGSNFRIDGASVAAAATSVGTLSSLTVSGDLTVDTSTLKVDSTNNRVGIGTASPSQQLHMVGTSTYNTFGSGPQILLADTSGRTLTLIAPGSVVDAYVGTTSNHTLNFITGNTTRAAIDTSGNLAVDTNTLYVDAANNRVGIGTASPSAVLHTLAANESARFASSTTANFIGLYHSTSTLAALIGNAAGVVTGGDQTGLGLRGESSIVMAIGNSEKARLDASGNLGLGVTPSAWGSAYKAFQFATTGSLYGESGDAAVFLGCNVYLDTGHKYRTSDFASQYNQENGVHKWLTAPSGTAGNAISFTQAMTLDASGNLLVGRTTANNNRLTIAGTHSSGRSIAAIQTTTAGNGNAVLLGFYNSSDTRIAYIGPDTGTGFAINAEENVPIIIYTNNAERARITSGGDFLVGTTSDTGAVANTARAVAGAFRTQSGTNASVANNTFVTLVDLNDNGGLYIFQAWVGGNGTDYSAWAVIAESGAGGTTPVILTQNNAGQGTTFQISGSNVQVKQLTGGAATINWSYLRIF